MFDICISTSIIVYAHGKVIKLQGTSLQRHKKTITSSAAKLHPVEFVGGGTPCSNSNVYQHKYKCVYVYIYIILYIYIIYYIYIYILYIYIYSGFISNFPWVVLGQMWARKHWRWIGDWRTRRMTSRLTKTAGRCADKVGNSETLNIKTPSFARFPTGPGCAWLHTSKSILRRRRGRGHAHHGHVPRREHGSGSLGIRGSGRVVEGEGPTRLIDFRLKECSIWNIFYIYTYYMCIYEIYIIFSSFIFIIFIYRYRKNYIEIYSIYDYTYTSYTCIYDYTCMHA